MSSSLVLPEPHFSVHIFDNTGNTFCQILLFLNSLYNSLSQGDAANIFDHLFLI